MFKKELCKILNPCKKERGDFLGELIFRGVTEMGIPEEKAKQVVFGQEKENRKKLIEEVELWLKKS